MVNWSPVYSCHDIDLAVGIFTSTFEAILEKFAPWISYQQRKKFKPWVSEETIQLIKRRNSAKAEASILSKSGVDASDAWSEFKQIRNKINNRLKFEEKNYKCKMINNSLDEPSLCWRAAKKIMNWKSSAGSPTRLLVEGDFIGTAYLFFINVLIRSIFCTYTVLQYSFMYLKP